MINVQKQVWDFVLRISLKKNKSGFEIRRKKAGRKERKKEARKLRNKLIRKKKMKGDKSWC